MKHIWLFYLLTLFCASTYSGPFDDVADGLRSIGADFSDNFTSNDAGSFKSKSRSGFSGGSFRKRIPRTTVSLVSITPPSIKGGGCSGIDLHFGSFSFINGDQIRELLSSYLQGVVGLAFTMAIEQGCPVCKSAMDEVASLANWANGKTLDSCAMAKGTMDAIFDKQSEACSGNDINDGGSDDKSQSKENGGSCGNDKTPQQIAESLGDQLNCDGKTNDELKACEDNRKAQLEVWGNSTVGFLQATGLLKKDAWENTDKWKAEFYVATLGTNRNAQWYPATFAPHNMMDALLCGTNPLGNAPDGTDVEIALWEETKNICDGYLLKVNDTRGAGFTMPVCENEKCEEVTTKTFKEWMVDYRGTSGFPFKEDGLLRTFGQAITNMENKARNGNQVFNDFELYLLSSAPFPLYRLINLSAFYPSATSELLGDNANVLAIGYAKGMVESLFKDIMSVRSSIPTEKGIGITPSKEISESIRMTASKAAVRPTNYVTDENLSMNLNSNLTKQIMNLEKSLLQSNINNGLNGLGLR